MALHQQRSCSQHNSSFLLLLALLLSGCASTPSYASVQATAQTIGCWPGTVATPNPVTVTPLAPVPVGVTATALPTTTPYPYCAGTLLTPLPSPVPRPKPYPTMEPPRSRSRSDAQTTFSLPGQTYQIDLAVHPTENWPVVALMQRWTHSDDGTQVFMRVFNPETQRWSTAQQVDTGTSATGKDRFASIVVAVTGDRVVHAAWGSSDGSGRIWTSASRDYGTIWSAPQQIASDCWEVLGMAATPDGQIVVLASGYIGASRLQSRAKLIVRRADGRWLAPDTVAAPGWFGTVVIVGDGAEARAVALTSGHDVPSDTAYLLSKRLTDQGAWTVQTRPISVPGAYHLHQRGIVFGERGIIFTWHGQYRANAGALVSTDGGHSWGQTETIFGGDTESRDEDAPGMYVTPAYDPRANRLIAIWTEKGTHYGAWSTPGSGRWTRIGTGTLPMPLVTGATDALLTAGTQTAGNAQTWLAWVDGSHDVSVRSVDLGTLIPTSEYPPAPPAPTEDAPPAAGGGT